MTRTTREQRRKPDYHHGPFARIAGFIQRFVALYERRKNQGVTILTFAQWRHQKWKDKLPPADELERFQYHAYLEQQMREAEAPKDQTNA